MKKNIKENLIKNYQMFNLNEEIFDNAINVSINYGKTSYIDVFNRANMIIESHLIKKCKDDIDIQILMLEKYNNAKLVITQIHGLDYKIAMQIYESSFEYVINNYDESKSIYQNLSKEIIKQIKIKIYGIEPALEKEEKIEQKKVEVVNEKTKRKKKEKNKVKEEKEAIKKVDEEKNFNEDKEAVDLINISKYINNKEFFRILKEKIENENDYLIAQLLFGYYGKNYDMKVISNFFEISYEEVLKIYKDVLKIYSLVLIEMYDDVIKLEYKND